MSRRGQGAVCFSTWCAHQQARFRDLERGCLLTERSKLQRPGWGQATHSFRWSASELPRVSANMSNSSSSLPEVSRDCRPALTLLEPRSAGTERPHKSPPGQPCTCPGRAAPCQTQGCVWISSTGGVDTGWDAWLGQATCWQRDCGQSVPLGIIS